MKFQTSILHLNYDLLRVIMLLAVASSGGASSLASTIAVCKDFSQFGDDEEILKIANFESLSVESAAHFDHIGGLLIKCAEAGNNSARYKLAQVILVGFSESLRTNPNCSTLLPSDQPSSSRALQNYTIHVFLSYFGIQRAIGSSSSNGSKFNHLELVSYFLSRSSFFDLVCMLPHLENYMNYFGWGRKAFVNFFGNTSLLWVTIRAVVDVGIERRTPRLWWSVWMKPQMTHVQEVINSVRERFRHHHTRRTVGLSQEGWEEMKRECKYIAGDIATVRNCAETIDTDAKIFDLEKRFFYYLAFDAPITREIYWPLDRELVRLRLECSNLARIYFNYLRAAVMAFDECFCLGK